MYWVTGLSGAGKTTLGKLLYEQLRESTPTVFLDGDDLREVFGSDLGYSREDRLQSAMRNARLCRLLAAQGLDVVCATISMFHACRRWNRAHIPGYVEIYLRAPLDVLAARDVKGLYRGGTDGNVVGVDLEFEEPDCPDVVITNDGTRSPESLLRELTESLGRGRTS